MDSNDAPITQLLLTVQFAPPASTPNPLQLAEIYAPLKDEFPIFEQVGRAGPMPIDPQAMHFEMSMGSHRNSFSSPDRQWALMFQEDRFSLGWSRTAGLNEPSAYPGFATVLSRAVGIWEQLRSRMFAPAMAPSPVVGEIVYNDQFDMSAGHGYDRLSSVFNILNPGFSAPMSSFNLNWTQPYTDDGFLQAGIVGPVLRPDGVSVSQYQTTSRFRITGGWDDVPTRFEVGHSWAIDTFGRLINPDFRAI